MKRKFIFISLLAALVTLGSITAQSEKPEDAAPYDQQVITSIAGEGIYLDWLKNVYKAAPGADMIQASLVRSNEDFNMLPEAAESWEVSEDGLTWTFHIRKGMVWSDGAPLTAHDYVYSFRRAANPETGYDFGWFFSWGAGIKNWGKVEGGELPLEDLGVAAPDDYTLTVTTETPKPFLPMIMTNSFVVPRQAVEKYGDDWATKAETMIFSGPYMVTEWVKGSHITFEANPTYNGPFKPLLGKRIIKLGAPETWFPAYLNDETDYCEYLSKGDLAMAQRDPELKEQLHTWLNFVTYYLCFDDTKSPFNDLKVRQAFRHAIDRELMCRTVLKDMAEPNYSILMRGFPAFNPALKEIAMFDPDKAKKLLAEAGYPDGKGFPKVELWIRDEAKRMAVQKPGGEFIQAQLKDNLGIEIEVKIMERKIFMDGLNKHTQNFFLIPYEFDFVDPSNFLGVFLGGGRHTWSNAEYDRLVREADAMMGDQEARFKKYQEAEKILVEDVGGVFLWSDILSAMWKPYVKGKSLEPNKQGVVAWRWNRMGITDFTIYVAEH